jgi:hypothetical protein
MKIASLCTVLLALAFTGCNNEPAGPTVHESQSIPHDAATALRADIHMGAGTLKLNGGSSGWLDAGFDYNVPEWKPTITYNLVGEGGDLRVEQPSAKHTGGGDTKNDWDLKLNNEIPTDLTAAIGAGDATLNLGTATLRSLKIEMGAGTLNLDLRGHPKRSYDLTIRGGAGDATVHLPASVGLYAEAGGGIGDVTVNGMRKDGDHWVNDAYGTSPVTVHADIKGGVGGITILAE